LFCFSGKLDALNATYRFQDKRQKHTAHVNKSYIQRITILIFRGGQRIWEITVPRKIAAGEGALEHLKQVKGNRALIVTGKTVKKMGFADKLQVI
jgi:hypothetical protein